MPDKPAHYRAFFSYARADGKLAGRLHRYLDAYKVPSALRGMNGARGPVPASLHPIFRDREDLAGGGELGERLRAALEASEALIVLCTPTAAKSQWVDEEIRLFRDKFGNGSIFPVIGAGDPESDDPEVQCMPPSLRGSTVLAADLRDIRKDTGHIIGDGPAGGRMKLLAGLLGVELDQLRRREDARRRVQMAAMAIALAAFVALAVVAVALGLAARRNAAEADGQRLLAVANAERARKGESLASQRAAAEAIARAQADEARQAAEEARGLAEEQRALALAAAAEAARQTGIAQTNEARAHAQFARAQGALADSFAQRGLAAAYAGKRELALRYALAGARISPASIPRQRVLLARLLTTPAQRSRIDVGSTSITFLAISPDGSRLMTSGLDKVARLFDTGGAGQIDLRDAGAAAKGLSSRGRTGSTRGRNADPEVGGTKLVNNWFTLDGRSFLISLESGRVELRDAASGAMTGRIGQHAGAVLSASFHRDGQSILTASLDDTARVWRIDDGSEMPGLKLKISRLRSAAWGPDGRSIVTMSLDAGLQLWAEGKVVAQLPVRPANAGALAITGDGSHAIEIDRGGSIRLSRLSDNETDVLIEGRNVTPGAFVISQDSRFVGVGRTDGRVLVWDVATRQAVADFVAHSEAVAALGLSPDSRLIATASVTGEVRLWDLAPLFDDFARLERTACAALSAGERRFSIDERAAEPLIASTWGSGDVCAP